MGKKQKGAKRHQNAPGGSLESTEDEGQENQIACKSCPHIRNSVNMTQLRKCVKKTTNQSVCQSCEKMVEVDNYLEYVVWLCLQCGHQGCDRNSPRQHSLSHYQTPRSSSHAMVLNTSDWTVWCYDCDDYVMSDTNKHLMVCVQFVKQQQKNCTNVKVTDTPNGTVDGPILTVEAEVPVVPKDKIAAEKIPANKITLWRIKGLSNQGNTCFFNAVVQALAQTQLLYDLLPNNVNERTISLADTNLPPLTVRAACEKSALTSALVKLVQDCRCKDNRAILSPITLFASICNIAPHFKGFQQQDSHELLRHMLDGLKTEEIREMQRGILKALDLDKVKPAEVAEDVRTKVRGYGNCVRHTTVDRIFSGQLISTVVCEECLTSSQVFETFLDLSLPVTEDKPIHPGFSRKQADDAFGYRTQTGRAASGGRRKDRKKAGNIQGKTTVRANRKESVVTDSLELFNLPNQNDSCEGDVEDNLESESNGDHRNTEEADEDAVQALNTEISELNLEEAQVEEMANGVEGPRRSEWETYWTECSRSTVVPREHPPENTCSVVSCLTRFTSRELLMGNNKFGCENCARTKGKKQPGKKPEMVYSNASKQLLVLNPPAVLTLHLKRFQQTPSGELRKVNRHVEFPRILDLASFCSSACWGLESLPRKQTRILYSLYGVVEHNGRLSGGHYTAFVKVRQKASDAERFLNKRFVDVTQKEEMVNTIRDKPSDDLGEEGARKDPVTGPSRWFHISDTHVGEVPESSVLKCQAYLLFYERIF